MVGDKRSGKLKQGLKTAPVMPQWLVEMRVKRDKVVAMSEKGDDSKMPVHHLPTTVLYPGSSEHVENYSVLDLDLKDPSALQSNFELVIAHHRQWVRVNSEVGYKWDGSELHQSWVSPPSGTYLHYVRYKQRLLCLVGDGAQSWLKGFISEDVAGEFHVDSEGSGKVMGNYIITTPNVKKIPLWGKGNYENALATMLGPRQMKKAFDGVWSVLHGGSSDLDAAMDTFIIHLWDSVRNDEIRELTTSAFDEEKEALGVRIDKKDLLNMRNWASMSDAAIRTTEEYAAFRGKDRLPWFGNPWDVLKVVRILHCPDVGNSGSFDMKNLPLPLGNGGRHLEIPTVLPSFLLTRYPNITKQSKVSKPNTEENKSQDLKTKDCKGNDAKKTGDASSSSEDPKKSENVKVDVKTVGSNLCCTKVVTKYKDAAKIVNDAMKFAVSRCQPDAKIAEICEKTDSFIREETNRIYQKMERGLAFPTSVSSESSNLSSPTNKQILLANELVKIDMGCNIDGFTAMIAHTHVVTNEKKVGGKAAKILGAANTAVEVALRLVRPRKKCKDVTEAIKKIASIYDCNIDLFTHQLERNKAHAKLQDFEFVENEVYVIDILTSSGEGKGKPYPQQGALSARLKLTLLLMPNGPNRATSHPLQELQISKSILENSDIKGWLQLSTRTKKKGRNRRKSQAHPEAWDVLHVLGDGNCLFRAIAHGIFIRRKRRMIPERCTGLEGRLASDLRSSVADKLGESREEMEEHIQGDFDKYVKDLREPGAWGGEPEIAIAARVLKARIDVYQRMGNRRSLLTSYGDDTTEPINLLYNGDTHYDLLVDPSLTNSEVGF